MRRPLVVLAAVTVVVIGLLWLLPPVGFVAAAVMLVLLPPWGRTLSERAVVSALVALGAVAVLFPRAGSTPVTTTSARLLVAALLIGFWALRLVPRLRDVAIPRPTLADGLSAVIGLGTAAWFMAAYVGSSSVQMVSQLFFSGWDNQAHFTTFANTYESASTTWPTVDGSVAWNQWYPTLHSTVWALAQLVLHPVGDALTRTQLLWPYVQWSALSFGLCLAALSWVAGDIAARLAGGARSTWARPLAVALFGVFAVLGTPAFLFNAGFTNFMMGVTVVVLVGYLGGRSLHSARTLGWFLVPLGGLIVIGLWTPLVLGIVPSGVVVAVALLRYRRWWGIAWLLGAAAIGVVMAVTQLSAILGVEPGQSSGDFTANLGAVSTGMVPFNLGLALLVPVVAVLAVVLLARDGRWPMAVAVAGPILGVGAIALYFVSGADTAGIPRLQAYYVLKPLDGMLIAAAPLIAAAVALAVVRAVSDATRLQAALAVTGTLVVAVGLFGYLGVFTTIGDGISAAPGIKAGADRARGQTDDLVGESIIRGQQAAEPFPDLTTMQWDGSGTLPNLWIASLHGVLSKKEQRFYKGLPEFPYDAKDTGYLSLSQNLDPTLRLALLWFRPSSGELMDAYVASRNDDRAVSVHVPMPPNDLCPECAP